MEYFREIWLRLSQCCHCTEEQSTLAYEPSERTHLLADTPVAALQHTNSFSQNAENSQKDHNALLNRLVQNTASNMIDIGAMELFNNLEHQEINDRIKMYSYRLQQQWNNIQHPNRASTGLFKDIPDPENMLVKMMIYDDLEQMKFALSKAHAAVNEIKVEHHEAIVVPFQIL